MEYCSNFFMLKKYSLINGSPKVISPTEVFGYVKLNKQHQNYTVTVVLNNPAKATAYAAINAEVVTIDMQPGKSCQGQYYCQNINIFCLVIPELGLFACNKTEQLYYGYNLVSTYILANQRQAKASSICGIGSNAMCAENTHESPVLIAAEDDNNSDKTELPKGYSQTDFSNKLQAFCRANCVHVKPLENIFNTPILATDFFDSIKHKLAKLFALGSPDSKLNQIYNTSKWVKLNASYGQNVVGVVYYLGYPFAVGVGKPCENGNYDIKFFSAASGKVLNIPVLQ